MFGRSSRKRASRVQLGSPRCARPNLVYLCALIVRGCFAKGSLYSPCHGNTRTTPARERALHGTHSAPGVSGELCPKLEAESKAAHRRARTCRARARSMRSAQSPCSSTRPRCARARPSARLLRGAMVAWSDRQEWEEAARSGACALKTAAAVSVSAGVGDGVAVLEPDWPPLLAYCAR